MFKSHLEKINRSTSRFHYRKKSLRLDKNERIIPFNKKTITDIKNLVTNNILQIYPEDFDKTIALLAKKEKVNKRFINLIPGADSGLKYLFEVLSKEKKILSIHPTYKMVEVFSDVYKQFFNKVLESQIDKKFLNKKYYKNTSFLYIANPNQPSGNIIDYRKILEIIKFAKKKKKYLIIDEAYIDFSSQVSTASLVEKHANLIVLKSFSKSIGIAGARIGYLIANAKINKMVDAVRSAGDISHFSLVILDYFLKKPKIWKKYLKDITSSKNFISVTCKKNKFDFRMTEGNFFYIFFKKLNYKKILIKLKRKKVLVKPTIITNNGNTKLSLRVTIGSIAQMKFFFKIIK
tara:strand:+ start:4068 stop:5111 length:1044 start_codon:yes stop_codon:yes gene_type:complete